MSFYIFINSRLPGHRSIYLPKVGPFFLAVSQESRRIVSFGLSFFTRSIHVRTFYLYSTPFCQVHLSTHGSQPQKDKMVAFRIHRT